MNINASVAELKHSDSPAKHITLLLNLRYVYAYYMILFGTGLLAQQSCENA